MHMPETHSSSQVFASAYIAIAVSAESAAHQIRQVIPDWQPVLELGFQGRLLMLIKIMQSEVDGRSSADPLMFVAAIGNDGKIRDYLASQRGFASRHALTSRGVPNRPAVSWFISIDVRKPSGERRGLAPCDFDDRYIDRVVAHAMPVSYVENEEVAMDIAVCLDGHLTANARTRLEGYRAAGIAPMATSDLTTSQGSNMWSIGLSPIPLDSLYALLEVHSDSPGVVLVQDKKRASSGSPLKKLISAHHQWLVDYKLAA